MPGSTRKLAAINLFRNASLESQQGLGDGAYSSDGRLSGPGNVINSIALLEPIARHTCLLHLSQEEQAQYQVWRVLAREELEGALYWFRVVKIEPLPAAVEVQRVASVHKGRAFSLVSEEWANTLFTPQQLGMSTDAFSVWQGFSSGQPPRLLLRLPKPVVLLLVNGMWARLAVPDIQAEGFSFLVGWPGVRDIERHEKTQTGL